MNYFFKYFINKLFIFLKNILKKHFLKIFSTISLNETGFFGEKTNGEVNFLNFNIYSISQNFTKIPNKPLKNKKIIIIKNIIKFFF
jgi:hypothetical protein